MPGRSLTLSLGDRHRFGFGGHEQDDEIKGNGNHLSFGDYGYDTRLGRRWNIDPEYQRIPQVSPYSYSLNNPILLKDPDGELPIIPFLLKAGAAAATDALLQASLIYLTDENVETFGDAFKKIDKSDVALSFIEGLNPFKTPGGKLGEAAAIASIDVLADLGEKTIKGEEVTGEDMGREFLIGFFSHLAGDKASDLLSNKTVRKKLGNLLGSDEVDKILYRFDMRSPQEIEELGGFKSWGNDMDLMGHASGKNIKNKTSGYVSTSKSEKAAKNFSVGRKGHLYRIENPGNGVDVNKKLGRKSPFPHEKEIAIPKNIPSKNIIDSKPLNQ